MFTRLHVCFLLQQWSALPPCLLSKTGHTHRQHRLTSSGREPLNFRVVSTATLPPDRHFFDGILERCSSFGNIQALYGNWTNSLHTLLWCPAERLLSSFGWAIPKAITYAFHHSPDSALGRQRQLCGDVLLSIRPYRLGYADVFMFAGYLRSQNPKPIFKPLSYTQMLSW